MGDAPRREEARRAGAAEGVLLSMACLVVAGTLVASVFFAGAVSRVGWLYPAVFWGLTAPFLALAGIVVLVLGAVLVRRGSGRRLSKTSMVLGVVSVAVLVAEYVILQLMPPRSL